MQFNFEIDDYCAVESQKESNYSRTLSVQHSLSKLPFSLIPNFDHDRENEANEAVHNFQARKSVILKLKVKNKVPTA